QKIQPKAAILTRPDFPSPRDRYQLDLTDMALNSNILWDKGTDIEDSNEIVAGEQTIQRRRKKMARTPSQAREKLESTRNNKRIVEQDLVIKDNVDK
ncbi:hypothetical protein U1Q18_027782, partial [Sarracenia purpurea var. burkii]